jgi:hypothetical protein
MAGSYEMPITSLYQLSNDVHRKEACQASTSRVQKHLLESIFELDSQTFFSLTRLKAAEMQSFRQDISVSFAAGAPTGQLQPYFT